MKLAAEIFEIYKSINFYDRYKSLSDSYRSEKRLESYSKEKIIEVINGIGYITKYVSKGNFFAVKENENTFEFTLNISLKYGLTELIIGSKNKETSQVIGGPFSKICKLIELTKGENVTGYLKHPAFNSYIELEEILIKVFNIYEDFKYEVLKQEGVQYVKKVMLSRQNATVIDLKQHSGRDIICSTSNEKELYTKTHKLQIEDLSVSFSMEEFKNLELLNEEFELDLYHKIINETNAIKNIIGGYDSVDGFTLRYLFRDGYLLVFSVGEVQPGLFKFYIEGSWELLCDTIN